jgi:hypothetical protein
VIERQNYTMKQADYDGLIERISASRKTSGMFLSGGVPMSDPQQTANDAWCELGRRMGFDGMSVEAGASKLQFSAIPATPEKIVAPEPEASADPVEIAAIALFTKHWQRKPDTRDFATGALDTYRVIAADVLATVGIF